MTWQTRITDGITAARPALANTTRRQTRNVSRRLRFWRRARRYAAMRERAETERWIAAIRKAWDKP